MSTGFRRNLREQFPEGTAKISVGLMVAGYALIRAAQWIMEAKPKGSRK